MRRVLLAGCGAGDSVVGVLPPTSGPFKSTPLDLPTAHSPMEIDHEVESMTAASPIPMGPPFDIGRFGDDHELDGDEEEEDRFFKEFETLLDPHVFELIHKLRLADGGGVRRAKHAARITCSPLHQVLAVPLLPASERKHSFYALGNFTTCINPL